MRILVLLLSLSIFISCGEEDAPTIKEYLEQNNIDAQFHSSGIYYTIDKVGSGGHPTATSDVTCHYKGYYLTGEVFDSSLDGDEVVFNLQNVIQGWTIGMPLYMKGGSGTLFIPAHLAYGEAALAFDIQLLDWE